MTKRLDIEANKDLELLFRVTKNSDPNFKPDTVDITTLANLFLTVSGLAEVVSGGKEVVTHRMEEGSLLPYFRFSRMQTKEAIVTALSTLAAYGMSALNPATAEKIEKLQIYAVEENVTIEVSEPDRSQRPYAVISPDTAYKKQEDRVVDEEIYLTGEIVRAGGVKGGKIELQTKSYGNVEVSIPKEQLTKFEENILYSSDFVFRVIGKRNLITNEFDRNKFKFIEVVSYRPKYDRNYLNELQAKASRWINEIDDPADYVAELRGY